MADISIWTLRLIVNSCVLLGCCTITKDVPLYPTSLISQSNISASQWMLKSSVRPWLIALKASCLHRVKSDMRTPKPASIALNVSMYTMNWHFRFARLARVSFPQLATDQGKHHITREVAPDVSALAGHELHICLRQTTYPGAIFKEKIN